MALAAPRVLIVDDERFFREALTDILTAAKFATDVAQDGREALAKLVDPHFGVVILDIQMPGMDGLQVLARLREMRPALRVIILSAHTDQERVLEALRAGAADYLAKPVHEEELVLAVQRAGESFRVIETSTRLRTRLRALEARVAALSSLAGTLRGDDAQKLLATSAAEAAAEVVGAAKTSVMLADSQHEQLHVLATVGRDLKPADFDTVKVGDPVAGKVFLSGEALLVKDVREDTRFKSHERYRAHSFLAVPMVSQQKNLGVLCATDRTSGEAFDEMDLALLHIIALQVTPLFERLQSDALAAKASGSEEMERTVEMHALDAKLTNAGEAAEAIIVGDAIDFDVELARRICEALSMEVEPSRILEASLAPIAEILGAAPVSVYLADATRGALVLEAQTTLAERKDRAALALDTGLTGAVFRTGKLVAADHPESDPRFQAGVDTPEDGRVTPLLCVPLQFRSKVLGVLRVFPSEAGMTSPRTGEVLAAALSAAVRNVLLYRSLVETMDEVATIRREDATRGKR